MNPWILAAYWLAILAALADGVTGGPGFGLGVALASGMILAGPIVQRVDADEEALEAIERARQ